MRIDYIDVLYEKRNEINLQIKNYLINHLDDVKEKYVGKCFKQINNLYDKNVESYEKILDCVYSDEDGTNILFKTINVLINNSKLYDADTGITFSQLEDIYLIHDYEEISSDKFEKIFSRMRYELTSALNK